MASDLIERQLYSAKYNMVHNPFAKGSSPRYKLVDDLTAVKPKVLAKPRGVTTIISKVISKDLMGWAVACAVEYLAEKLPVITQEDLNEAALAYTVKRDSGASTGTEAHALVEGFLKGEDSTPNGTPEALNAFNAFKKWYAATKPSVINVEEVIYSQEYQYAGTYDCMLRIDGKVYLCDLKTTTYQLAAGPRPICNSPT